MKNNIELIEDVSKERFQQKMCEVYKHNVLQTDYRPIVYKDERGDDVVLYTAMVVYSK